MRTSACGSLSELSTRSWTPSGPIRPTKEWSRSESRQCTVRSGTWRARSCGSTAASIADSSSIALRQASTLAMLPCFASLGLRVRPGTLAHAPFDTVTARRQPMVRDAFRGYLALANGLTEVTAGRARAAAKALAEQGEATAGQVSALAEDLISTSRRNRESLVLLVRHEVEQAVKRLGVAPSGDVEELTRRVRELERTVRGLKAAGRSSSQTSPGKKSSTPRKQTEQN